jgi:hypothetical protein
MAVGFMKIRELIADLQDALTHEGNLEVRAATATNPKVIDTTEAYFRVDGRRERTLFLDLEGED